MHSGRVSALTVSLCFAHRGDPSPMTIRFFESLLYSRSIVAISPSVVLHHLGSAIGVLRKSKLALFFPSIRKSYFFSPIAKFPIGWSRLYEDIVLAILERVSPRLAIFSSGMMIWTS